MAILPAGRVVRTMAAALAEATLGRMNPHCRLDGRREVQPKFMSVLPRSARDFEKRGVPQIPAGRGRHLLRFENTHRRLRGRASLGRERSRPNQYGGDRANPYAAHEVAERIAASAVNACTKSC